MLTCDRVLANGRGGEGWVHLSRMALRHHSPQEDKSHRMEGTWVSGFLLVGKFHSDFMRVRSKLLFRFGTVGFNFI